jgi:hypothetical protein
MTCNYIFQLDPDIFKEEQETVRFDLDSFMLVLFEIFYFFLNHRLEHFLKGLTQKFTFCVQTIKEFQKLSYTPRTVVKRKSKISTIGCRENKPNKFAERFLVRREASVQMTRSGFVGDKKEIKFCRKVFRSLSIVI